MNVGSDDEAKIYLNGKEVCRLGEVRSYVLDQDVVANVAMDHAILSGKSADRRYRRPEVPEMSDVTHILNRVHQGDAKAAEELLPLVYEELRKLAAHRMACEAAGQTLQPTALVHEAWLRLVRTPDQAGRTAPTSTALPPSACAEFSSITPAANSKSATAADN